MHSIEWALLPFKRYFSFSGRSCRREFWWFTLATTIFGFAMDGVDYAIGSEIGWVGLVFTLFIMIPSLAVAVRRLHDINRSGWWLLILIFPAFALGFLGNVAALEDQFGNAEPTIEPGATDLETLAALIITCAVLFIVMALPGSRGVNRFGSEPYGVPEPEVS